MTNDLTLFKGGVPAARSSVFNAVPGGEGKLSAGIGIGFASVRFKAARWAIKFQGQTTPLVRYSQGANGQLFEDGPQPYLDCIILDVAEQPAKYYYEGRYTEGDNQAPDCFSSNGIVPDTGAPKKQSPTCVACKWNAWGSKITTDGTVSRGKQCSDHKRLVVVPVADIENKMYGGPMLLQVPPTSLKGLVPYEQKLAQAGFRFFEVWTRISFDQQSAYPLFVYDAFAPLTDAQAQQVVKALEDPVIDRILNSEIVGVEDVAEIPAQVSQPQPAAPAQPAPLTPAPLTPAPVGQPDLTIPAHLQRTAPQAAPQPMTPPAAPTPPANQPQASPTRPPGMTDVEWNQYLEFLKSKAQPAPAATPAKRTRARTQPVSPQPTTAPAAQETAAPQPVTGAGNGVAQPANNDAIAKIGEALKTLI